MLACVICFERNKLLIGERKEWKLSCVLCLYCRNKQDQIICQGAVKSVTMRSLPEDEETRINTQTARENQSDRCEESLTPGCEKVISRQAAQM